jgi:hypothetical protein
MRSCRWSVRLSGDHLARRGALTVTTRKTRTAGTAVARCYKIRFCGVRGGKVVDEAKCRYEIYFPRKTSTRKSDLHVFMKFWNEVGDDAKQRAHQSNSLEHKTKNVYDVICQSKDSNVTNWKHILYVPKVCSCICTYIHTYIGVRRLSCLRHLKCSAVIFKSQNVQNYMTGIWYVLSTSVCTTNVNTCVHTYIHT